MFKLVLLFLALGSHAYAKELRATVLLSPDPTYSQHSTHGSLELYQADPSAPVQVTGWIKGLKKSSVHGIHIHEKGDITKGCASVGGHFNPDDKRHGAYHEDERHAGDVGNVESDELGFVKVNFTDSLISLTGPRSIIGRSFVIHADEDDFGKSDHPLSEKTGNAGERWSCGVVGLTFVEEIYASVMLSPDPAHSAANVHGVIKLTQAGPNGPVKVSGWVTGLKKNSRHGIHIHEKGDITNGCKSIGGHFNPDDKKHGAYHENERHAGDLGNIKSDENGRADIYFTDSMITLTGPKSIIGRSFVIHADEDDFGKGKHPLSEKTGNAGDRWSCGVIGIGSSNNEVSVIKRLRRNTPEQNVRGRNIKLLIANLYKNASKKNLK